MNTEIYAPGEESIQMGVPAIKQIIAVTAKQRDVWDESDKGDTWKTLKRAVATHQKHWRLIVDFIKDERLIVDSIEDVREATYTSNMIKLTPLQNFRDDMVNKLKKAHHMLTVHQAKLEEVQQAKVRGQQSIETKVFKVLKEIGVELSSYHGGSLNGKDIKKVMNNASHIFNQFAAIFKGGKREECLLADADIDSMCLHFWEVCVLWDGAFSFARKINSTDEDAETYQTFI